MRKIGIPAWAVGENSFGVTKPYLEFIKSFDAIPIILFPGQEMVQDLDLLLMPGGSDVDTMRYNQIPGMYTGRPNHYLEWFDKKRFWQYVDNGTKVFGICRGMQSINVLHGGDLNQHIEHPYTNPNDRSELVHGVYHTDDPKNIDKMFLTNSIHHQSCDRVPVGLEVVLRCKEDDTVEAIKSDDGQVWGVQWHPEEIYDKFSVNTIKGLLGQAIEEQEELGQALNQE